jgi:hypothetical protein
MEDLWRWLALVGAVLLIGLLVAALHVCGVRVCLFHRFTGLPCLTCGGSRALAALLAGDFAGAFRVQPLVCVLAAAGLSGAAVRTLGLVVWRRKLSVKLPPAAGRLFAVLGAVLVACNWAYLVWRGV